MQEQANRALPARAEAVTLDSMDASSQHLPGDSGDGRGDAPGAPVIFDAVLAPNRSLGRMGFAAVMAGVIVVSVGLGTHFLLQGAWPVFGFFGLDIALLYLAFRLSYRSGRLRELIRVTGDEVVVRRIAPNGRTTEWRFNPYWLRIALDEPVEHHSQITLSSHGRSLVIGAYLAPEERASLVRALRAALGEANRRYGDEPATQPDIEAAARQPTQGTT